MLSAYWKNGTDKTCSMQGRHKPSVCTWNLKSKQINKHTNNRNRLINTEKKLVVARGEGGEGQEAKQVKEIKRYKPLVIK